MQVTFLSLHDPKYLLQPEIVSPFMQARLAQPSLLSPTPYLCPSGHWQVPPHAPTPEEFFSTLFFGIAEYR